MNHRTLVWFRTKDLRLSDHQPLRAALDSGGDVIPLFVLEPRFFEPARARQAPHRMQFLLESVRSLQHGLAARGSGLVLARGEAEDVVPRLARELGVGRVVAQGSADPFARQRDARIQRALGDRFELYGGETLHPAGALRTRAGNPYAVFSQFAHAFHLAASIPPPRPPPRSLPRLPKHVMARPAPLPALEDLVIPRNPYILPGGEESAKERLQRFLKEAAGDYARHRDRLDLPGTSRLSQDLTFGTLSPREVWTAVRHALGTAAAAQSFLNELVWREFTYSTLFDRPELLKEPFRREFAGFPWTYSEAYWQAWVQGRTGYPVVDASARQLLSEGFVHNRARMISASFLTKHLLIHYKRGEAHYLKYLTDGDCAQNNAGWQWAAGCGADAQPYFRIFNPVLQGEKFDPEGSYVRKWVPALARMPTRFIHCPWEAPEPVLRAAGVALRKDYPWPIVDHALARMRFLALARAHLRRPHPQGDSVDGPQP